MKSIASYFVLGLFVWGFTSCEDIDCLYPNTNDCSELDTVIVEPPPPPDSAVVRKILLEEFTGVGCGNCPDANLKALNLLDKYPNHLISMGLHAGFFSIGSGNPHGWNLNSDEAQTYYNTFNVLTNPIATVNRKAIGSNPDVILLGDDKWEQAILNFVNDTPEGDVELGITATYDVGSRTIGVTVDLDVRNDLSSDYRLVVAITEDYIIGVQTDYNKSPTTVLDYEHRHVLRSTITDPWGEFIIQGGAAAGETESVMLNAYSLNGDWAENNCSIIAYVYDDASGEIIQAEEIHLIE